MRRREQDRPSPSIHFRDRSVFDGVARREVGGVDLLAHSVAVLVPSLTALGTGLSLPSFVGPGFWVSTVLGFGVVALLVQTFNQFASRFGSAGTLYTFVAKGLGPFPALMVAGGLVIGYSAMIGFGLGDGSNRFRAALAATGVNVPGSALAAFILLGLGAVLCLYAMSRGIHWSTRAALIAEIASFGILIAVFATWTARYGMPTWSAFSLKGASPARILTGAATIVTLTLAFESSASLSLETRRPFRDVPFALRSSVGLAFVLFTLANVVATVRPADAPSIWSWRWFAPGADQSVIDALVLVVLAWSLVALALCVWCALARLIFTLAREGVLPARLGVTTTRGVPLVAATAVIPLVIILTLAAVVSGTGPFSFSWTLKESGTVVICLAYVFTAIALPRFLWSIDEVTWWPVLGASIAGLSAATVTIHEVIQQLQHGSFLALALVALATLIGSAMSRQMRSLPSAEDRYVGMHDEAVAASVVLPPEAPTVPRAEP